jgi:Spy/CpxP family protein refolding chaperone
VAIAVAALDVILANVPNATPAAMTALTNTTNPYHTAQYKYNLSRSVVHPTWAGAFKHAWNSKAKQLNLKVALLP